VAVPAGGGGAVNLVEGDHQICAFHVTPDGRRAALVMADPVNPGEVYALDLEGDRAGTPRCLTDLNADLFAEVQVLEPERLRIKSSDDITVEGWVLKPPGFSKERKHPLILQIHGGPHAQYGSVLFHEFQVLAGLGYVVLYMNPRGSQGYGEDFARAINEAWGDRDYMDLMEAVDAILEEGYIDEKRMGVAGGSYGGYMTNWIVGHTDRFAAAVTMRSVVNMESFFGSSDFGFEMRNELGGAPWQRRELYRKLSPITYVENIKTPLLIIHSEQDHRCPIEQAEQLYAALRALKREVLFIRYPEEGHGLSRGGKPEHRVDRLQRIIEWFSSVTAT
jgi:dipeptidyl aminopeptidase/acylaminoacyl peptidase